MLDAIEKQRAIRKSGERIVKRVVQKLLLGDAPLGDVRPDARAAESAALRAAKKRVVPEDHATIAAARHDLHLVMRGDHAASDVRHERGTLLFAAFVRQKKIEEITADHFLFRVAGQREHERIDVRDETDDIEQHGAELDRVEHLAKAAIRFAQRLRDAAAFIEIERHRHPRAASR